MKISKISISGMVIGVVCVGIFFFNFYAPEAQGGHCRDNSKPVTAVKVKLFAMECNGAQTGTQNPIPLTCLFKLDATGFWQNACESDGSGNVTWSESPSGVVEKLPRGGLVFNPWYKPLKEGTVTITATLDGVSGSINLGIGSGTVIPPGGGTGGGNDPGEADTMCAYSEGTSKTCVPDTYHFSAEQCGQVEICKQKTCTVTPRDQCKFSAPVVTIRPIVVPPAENLGQLIENVFNVSLMVVGIAVFVMAVYGGFLMVLAGGFPEMNSKGRAFITQAFLGAILLLSAYVILNTINPDFVEQRGTLKGLPPAGTR